MGDSVLNCDTPVSESGGDGARKVISKVELWNERLNLFAQLKIAEGKIIGPGDLMFVKGLNDVDWLRGLLEHLAEIGIRGNINARNVAQLLVQVYELDMPTKSLYSFYKLRVTMHEILGDDAIEKLDAFRSLGVEVGSGICFFASEEELLKAKTHALISVLRESLPLSPEPQRYASAPWFLLEES